MVHSGNTGADPPTRQGNMTTVETNVHFREHDVEFLQKRAKLWLEAVLGERYGDRSLAELIADGSILYRVSKYITREVTGASPGPQEISPKTFSEVAIYGKHSGKYLPYANVDTFLKICRKVGLTDVELFTPPDAVEGKDIRRVCTSIRSLARKARAQHIRVPDFEDVNRPLPMPKEKVGEIKENLQHSSSTQASPMVATPEADIQKSERVQIISRFLSSTSVPPSVISATSPSDSPPVTPLKPMKGLASNSFSSNPSTPAASIEGVNTPALSKSLSVLEPSPLHDTRSTGNLASTPKILPLDEPELEKNHGRSTPSSAPPAQRGLGTYRHAQPHFIKKSSSQTDLSDSIKGLSGAIDSQPSMPLDDPKLEKTPVKLAPSSDHLTGQSNESSVLHSQRGLSTYRHAQPHFIKKSSSQNNLSNSFDELNEAIISQPSKKPLPTTVLSDQPTNHTKESVLSDQPTNLTKELSLSNLLGSYKHAQPHFIFKKSAQPDVPDHSLHSEDIQSQFLESLPQTAPEAAPEAAPDAANLRARAPSSNKVVEKGSRILTVRSETPPKDSRPRKVNGASAVPAKEPLGKPISKSEAKAAGIPLNLRLWMPVVAGALAFLGTLLVVRTRDPVVYEVKRGDTLTKISRRVGKDSWDELVKLNPSITNPNLIYPSERLKLPL